MALDEEALLQLVRSELPTVYTFCFRLCANAADTETVCQATFNAARQKHPAIPLTKIAAQEWKSRLNSLKGKPDVKDVPSRAFQTLSPDEKIVLLYHDIDKKSIDETASLLGVSTSNARTRLSRARDAYRHAVERATAGKRP